jgi:hypothetical protein
MSDKPIPEGGGAILWTVIAAVVWLAISLGIWLYVCKKDEVTDRVVPKAISDRMKYHHGVPVVFTDWNGNDYFIRDGQRCKF